VESPAPSREGLRLLPVVTIFSPSKTTVRVRARVARAPGPFDAAAGSEVTAYEIHAGRTRVAPDAPRLFAVFARGGAPAVDAGGLGGHVVGALAARLGALGALVEALALACLLSLRSLAAAALGVKTALAAGDLAAARAAVGRHLVSRPTATLDAGHVASAT